MLVHSAGIKNANLEDRFLFYVFAATKRHCAVENECEISRDWFGCVFVVKVSINISGTTDSRMLSSLDFRFGSLKFVFLIFFFV